jgi:hypothetical protein
MINDIPPTLAERLVQLRTAVTSFAHSLSQDEADRLAPLLSHVGELYYAAAEALAQDEELTYRQANDTPALVQVGAAVTVVDEDCVACGGGGWTDLHDVCPECAVKVYACMYCEQSICRDDSGWRRYGFPGMAGDPWSCEQSPDETHIALCGDCAGRGGTIGQMCATCEGRGYLA